MSNVKDAPLFSTPQVVRAIVTPAPAKDMANIPFAGYRLVDEVQGSICARGQYYAALLTEVSRISGISKDDIENAKWGQPIRMRNALWFALNKLGLSSTMISKKTGKPISTCTLGIMTTRQSMNDPEIASVVSSLIELAS